MKIRPAIALPGIKLLGAVLLGAAGPLLAAQGAAPLVELVESGQSSQAIALIDRGADVNAVSADGTTALIWAVHRDDQPLIRRLLKAHANSRTANRYGATAMLEAAVVGEVPVI